MASKKDIKRKLLPAAKFGGDQELEANTLPITTTKARANETKKLTVLERRAQLASLLPRGYSYAELALQLQKKGFTDHDNKPLAEAIVKSDIHAIESYWKEFCAETVDKHRSRQMMELSKLKDKAYEVMDFELVLKILSKEIDLLGTKVAVREVGNAAGTTIFDFRSQAMSFERQNQLVMGVLNSAGKRASVTVDGSKDTVDTTAKTASGV